MLGGRKVPRHASALPRPVSHAVQNTCSIRSSTTSCDASSTTIGPISGRVASVHRHARPRLRLRTHGDRLSPRRGRFSGRARTMSKSPPTAAGNRPAYGSTPASRTRSQRTAATKSPPSRSTANLKVALRTGRRDDRVPRRPPAGHVARRDRFRGRTPPRRRHVIRRAGGDRFAATLKPAASGTLYLRVNDSAAQLDDNRGTLTVTIEQAASVR